MSRRPPSAANLSMRQLRAFAGIAEAGSLTRAAERLHLTQSGLSGMLREMEQQLDCRLFERTTRALSLTPHGEAMLPVVVQVLAEIDAAVASLGDLNAVERRRLTVGATPVVASSLMPEACAAFAGRHPGVRVDCHDLDRAEVRAGVQSGHLDAGFGVFLDAAGGLRRLPLLRSSLVLADAGAAPVGAVVGWNELGTMTLLALPTDNPIQRLVESHLKDAGLQPQARRVSRHLHTLLAMVEAGVGAAVLPSFVSAAAERYRVDLRPIARPRVEFDFYEITRSGAPRNPLLADFSACLVETMRSREKAAPDR